MTHSDEEERGVNFNFLVFNSEKFIELNWIQFDLAKSSWFLIQIILINRQFGTSVHQ